MSELAIDHMPAEAQAVVTQLLELLALVDAQYQHDPSAPLTATKARRIPMDAREYAQFLREWLEEREPIMQQIMKVAALYPKHPQFFISAARAKELGLRAM